MRTLIFAALLVLACTPERAPTQVVPLGAALDRTGAGATPSWVSSIQLALADANGALATSEAWPEAGFTVLFGDTQGISSLAIERAQQLTGQGARALLLQSSSESLAVNGLNYDQDGAGLPDTSNDLGVPLLCGACTSTGINNPSATNSDPTAQAAQRDPDGWLFRSVMSNGPEIRLLAQELATAGDTNGDGRFKVTLYTNNSTGSFRKALKAALVAAAPGVIIEEGVTFDETANALTYDFNADVTRLTDGMTENSSGTTTDGVPDAIVENAPAGFAGPLVKAMRAAGATVPLKHTVNFRNPLVVEVAGDLANGEEGVSVVLTSDSASGGAFADALYAATGAPPVIEDANFYDGAAVYILAVLVAAHEHGFADPREVTGPMVKDALARVNDPAGVTVYAGEDGFAAAIAAISAGQPIDYEGASGPMDFDTVGNVKAVLEHYRVESRRFVRVNRYDCVTDDACPSIP